MAKETVEDLQFKGLKLIQNDRVFKFGTDGVLLAGFVQARRGERVVDLGTGCGIIPVLLAARTGAKVIGIEIQQEAANLAKRNVQLNHQEEQIQIIEGDLRHAPSLVTCPVQVVVCNPPYDLPTAGKVSAQLHIRIARYEVACCLEDVVKSAASLLQTGGRFFMIHRVNRMAEIMHMLRAYRLEPKVMQLIAPKAGEEPNYMLVKCIRDAAAGIRLLPQLEIRGPDGAYTDRMNRIYHRD